MQVGDLLPSPWAPGGLDSAQGPTPQPLPHHQLRAPERESDPRTRSFHRCLFHCKSTEREIHHGKHHSAGPDSPSFSASVSISISFCCCGSTSPCVSGCLLQMARVSQALWGVSSPHRPCLSLSASPPVSVFLILWVSASPSDSVLHLCVSLSPATSGSTFCPCQETRVVAPCSHLSSSRAHRGPCPTLGASRAQTGMRQPRAKAERLPPAQVHPVGGGEARGAQTGCGRARTGWRGQLCPESLGPGQWAPRIVPLVGPFSAGPFPLSLFPLGASA